MGIKLFSVSESCYEPTKHTSTVKSPNPDPKNFLISKFEVIEEFLIVKVKYPNCTNFEGNKILVYKDVSASELFASDILDPHFFDGIGITSPVARFIPTDIGWAMALHFCQSYSGTLSVTYLSDVAYEDIYIGQEVISPSNVKGKVINKFTPNPQLIPSRRSEWLTIRLDNDIILSHHHSHFSKVRLK